MPRLISGIDFGSNWTPQRRLAKCKHRCIPEQGKYFILNLNKITSFFLIKKKHTIIFITFFYDSLDLLCEISMSHQTTTKNHLTHIVIICLIGTLLTVAGIILLHINKEMSTYEKFN